MLYNRRHWLQQGLVALAGLTVAPEIFGMQRNRSFLPPGAIWLNSNENPYGPSPLAKKAILAHYTESNRYPDDGISSLRKKVAEHWRVGQENILMGAGSSEIIGLASLYVSMKNKKVILAEPGYQVWNGQAAAFGLGFIKVPLDANRQTDLGAMSAAISGETAMVYICNPNNPTGTFVDVNKLKNFTIAAAKKTLVFIDEAYTEFADLNSLAALAITNPNIVVAKTFSKIYGLAGARIGYAIAHPDTVKKLASFQPWSNGAVSTVSVAAAMASLDDGNFVKDMIAKTASTRSMCTKIFQKLSLEYITSSTNFMLFNIDPIKKDFLKEMEAKNIYVQSRDHFNGKWCRVSMGTIDEMESFCKALEAI